jgi:hypothetical protein
VTAFEDLERGDIVWGTDPLGEQSYVLPWSLATLNSAADVEHYLTSLVDTRTDDVARQLVDYISS